MNGRNTHLGDQDMEEAPHIGRSRLSLLPHPFPFLRDDSGSLLALQLQLVVTLGDDAGQVEPCLGVTVEPVLSLAFLLNLYDTIQPQTPTALRLHLSMDSELLSGYNNYYILRFYHQGATTTSCVNIVLSGP